MSGWIKPNVALLGSGAAAPAEADVDWFAVAQQLIAAGHDRQQIRRYSYAELVGYLQAIAEQSDRNAQHQAAHTAAALSGGSM